MSKIARVVKITKLDDLDERDERARYRDGCLALTPDERVAEVRLLSRRIRLINPKNPRSPHIQPVVRIYHDAV